MRKKGKEKASDHGGTGRQASHKNRHLFPLVIPFIIVLSTLLVYWSTSILPTYDVRDIGTDIYVGSVVGFNVGTDAVHLGEVTPGGRALRFINVTAGPFQSMVSIEVTGNISRYITVSENDFVLNPYENRRITVYANIPKDAKPPLFFSGNIRLVFRKTTIL